MTSLEIVVLIAICAAFSIFAAILAWGDLQTRNLPQAANSKPALRVVDTQAAAPVTAAETAVQPVVAAY